MRSTTNAYNVVAPTGSDDTTMLAAAFASSATQPVMLSFGKYQVSAPLVIPIGGVVCGAGEVDASQPWATGNIFKCCLVVQSPGNWGSHLDVSGRVACVYPGSYSLLRDISIYGGSSTNTLVDGVQFQNVTWAYCENVFAVNCNTGFSGYSNARIAGDGGNPQGNNNIANVIRGGAARQCNRGFFAWGANGGYCSDMEISGFWVSASQAGPGIYCGSGWGNGKIVNCRIEDQGSGLVIQNTGQIMVANCLFDRNGAPIAINNSSDISITGCMSASAGNTGSGSGGTGTHVVFGPNNVGPGGNCDNVQLAGNVYNKGASAAAYCYGVSSGVTVTNSAILESGGGNTAVYQDAYSASVLTPLRIT